MNRASRGPGLALLAGCSGGAGAPAQGDATPAPDPPGRPDPRAATRSRDVQGLPPESLSRVVEQHARVRGPRPGVRRHEQARSTRDPRRARRLLHQVPRADGGDRQDAPRDGLDLERLPDKERGVSCYFCHNVTGVEGDHNAMLQPGQRHDDARADPRSAVSPARTRLSFRRCSSDTSPKSTAMCGGCHDIVTPTGVHLERTFEEYRERHLLEERDRSAAGLRQLRGLSHAGPSRGSRRSCRGVGLRTVHEHLWPGIDVPLTDFPHRDALRSAVEDCQLGIASVSFFTLEVTPPDLFSFQIETNAGHNQPSGAAQDRRMWLEVLGLRRERPAARPGQQRQHRGRRDRRQARGRSEARPAPAHVPRPHLRRAGQTRAHVLAGRDVDARIPTATSRTCCRRPRRPTSTASTPC